MVNEVQFVVELAINAGEQEDFKKWAKAAIDVIEAKEPETIAYRWHLNDDETMCYISEWYPSSDVLAAHLENVGPSLAEMLKVSKITRFEVFGNLTPAAKEMLEAAGANTYGFWEGFSRR
jgi:quinol monooxygenase YgiN